MRDSPSGDSAERWAIRVAAVSVVVFLVWALTRAEGIVHVIYQNSDYASGPVLAELLSERGGGAVILGNYRWLEPLYALHLTRWLPDHLQLWEVLPILLYAATVALIAWTVRRAIAGRPALVIALALAAPAPLVTFLVGAANQRLFLLAHCAILAAYAVTLPAVAKRRLSIQLVWAVTLAITLAPGAASDPLVIIGGVIPFLGAVALGGIVRAVPPRAAILAGVAGLAGAAGGAVIVAVAERNRIVSGDNPFGLADLNQLGENAWWLLQDVALFTHGRLGDDGALDPVTDVIAWGVILAVPIILIAARRPAREALTEPSRPPEQRLLAAFWGLSAIALSIAFLATTAPADLSSVRYILPLWPALLILGAIAFGRRAIPAIAALAAVTAIVGCVELATGSYTELDRDLPEVDEVRELERFVEANELDHGYSGYWDSAAITALSDFAVRVYPVFDCGYTGDGRCQHPQHTIDSWYWPRRGVRTFYVVDDRGAFGAVDPPPSRWGPPLDEARIGHLHAFAYDFDLAAVLPEGVPAPKTRPR